MSRAFVLIVLFILSCKRDGNLTKLQYAPDMADSPTVKSQQEYLDPPEGSVSYNAVFYPKTAKESEALLSSPFAQSRQKAKHLAQGEWLWKQFCITCHGKDAKGVGDIVDVYPRAPDLTLEQYKKRKDGFFFHRITFGNAVMPGYGYATEVDERWKIVLYLRKLQGLQN